MLICTSWKQRQLSAEQTNRLMEIWGKIEADTAQNPDLERVCWYMFGDGTGGFTVNKVHDPDAANAFGLEIALALGDFLELDSRIVLELETAMPSILKAVERINT
jgi:hypothetical protein